MSTIDPSPIDLNSELMQVPSSAKVEKSQKIMSNMIATGQLTPEGAAFLKLNTDPWHDNKTTGFRGIPSKGSNQVVTMSVVQEITVRKPASLPAGNWQVRVGTQPIATTARVRPYKMSGSALYAEPPGPGTPATMWPVQIDYAEDQTNFALYNNANTTGLQIPKQFCTGPFQVAGMGLEVINTTASLQKQGLATCAVMNQSTSQTYAVSATTQSAAAFPAAFSAYTVKTLPQNLQEMLLLPGTTQWEAAEGAYSVVQLLDLDQAPTGAPRYPIFMNDEYNNDPAAVAPPAFLDVAGPHVAVVAYTGYANNSQTPISYAPQVPMNSTVHMYTGLSDQTTLTVRVRWLVVRFPNDNEPEILVLAFNSAPWDPVALEIQSRLLNKLPPAVMFKMNPKQEWWKAMIAGIADIASSGLMMMPHPLAKGAGVAIAGARAALLPNEKVLLKAAKTKTGGTPAQRATAQQAKQANKKKQKRKKKKAKPAKAA